MVNYVIPDMKKKYALLGNIKIRCYKENYQKKNPTYQGCYVCREWLKDSSFFYKWVDENYYIIEGMPKKNIHLDKDILVPGNKIYSAETCLFVPLEMNIFIATLEKPDSLLPPGVYKYADGKYKPNIYICGKKQFLGTYSTTEEAFEVYKPEKIKECERLADKYKDMVPEKVTEAFLQWTEIIKSLTINNYKDILSKKECEIPKECKRGVRRPMKKTAV